MLTCLPPTASRPLQLPPDRRQQIWRRLSGVPRRPHAVSRPVLRAPAALPPAHHSLHASLRHARLAPGGRAVLLGVCVPAGICHARLPPGGRAVLCGGLVVLLFEGLCAPAALLPHARLAPGRVVLLEGLVRLLHVGGGGPRLAPGGASAQTVSYGTQLCGAPTRAGPVIASPPAAQAR